MFKPAKAMLVKRPKPWAVGAGLAALLVGGCSERLTSGWDFVRGHISARSTVLENWTPSEDAVQRGAMQFAFGDYGGLNSDAMNSVALPWKLSTAALVQYLSPQDVSQEALRRILTGYGFLYPEHIANWPQGSTPPSPAAALGIVLGTGTRSMPQIEVQIASTGCANCHAAPVYRADGTPDPAKVWLGAPNPSIDLETYTQDIYRALVAASGDTDRLMATTRTLYPEMTAREEKTLRDFVLPRVHDRLEAIAKTGEGPLPFANGHAGVTNGVAALKLQHGMLKGDEGAFERERGFTSIPHLSDRTFRSTLLWDGAYAPVGSKPRQRVMTAAEITPDHVSDLAGIVAYFTVPTMGMSGDAAVRAIPQVREAFGFVGTVRPQAFPGPIDRARADRGAVTFAAACSSCHGTYQPTDQGPRLVRFPNASGSVGTDPVRAQAIDQALADKVNRSPIKAHIRAESTGTYAAPPLTGLWQSAPYLHNGSVPSLAALLGLEARPVTFRVGGHAMDYQTVGIAYPAGYTPYSRPSLVDTRQRGMGNGGHSRMFEGLSLEERRDLLEYLKQL